ncbi:MAG: 50S ribosomal protein L3 [Candidatus Moraniibacteriota bacterium]
MTKFLLGKKIGMTQWWNESKEAEAITLVDCKNLVVTRKRTLEKDKYSAVVLGIIKKKQLKSASDAKFLKRKANFELIKEFAIDKPEDFTKTNGDKVGADIFTAGDTVKVTGISKGKGTQGVVKRHNFSGGPKSHGHRHVLRSGGSIGSAFPEHVQKGKKMAGRMGNVQVSVKNLKIAWTDTDKDIVAVKGAVPGRKGSWVKIIEN